MKVQLNLAAKAALVSALLATSACEVLTQNSPTALSTDETFSTSDRIGKAAVGLYNSLQDAEFYGGRVLIYGDSRSDDTDPSAYFTGISDFTALSNNGLALNAWTGGYRTIYAANLFLQNLAAHPNIVDAATTAQYNAEAKFVRAICYFQLCNLYAQPYGFTADASHLGVPLILSAAADANAAFSLTQQVPRASVKAVYAQIEKDLLEALPDLPASSKTPSYNNQARATKSAAEAMLMRLYLYKGDYASSLTRANNVVATGAYSLNATPVTTFRTYPTAESIFSVAMNINDNPNTNNSLGQHYFVGGRADITINPYVAFMKATYAADDKRLVSSSFVAANGIPNVLVVYKPAAPTVFYTNKYTSVADWVPVVRYPEVLLTQAEDLVLTTNTVSQTAVTALNTVRDRSRGATTTSYTVASFATPADLLTAIRTERRAELAFEGLRFYDLLRYKQGIPARGTVAAVPYGDPKLVLPIPFLETQSNPNLVQNPGY